MFLSTLMASILHLLSSNIAEPTALPFKRLFRIQAVADTMLRDQWLKMLTASKESSVPVALSQ